MVTKKPTNRILRGALVVVLGGLMAGLVALVREVRRVPERARTDPLPGAPVVVSDSERPVPPVVMAKRQANPGARAGSLAAADTAPELTAEAWSRVPEHRRLRPVVYAPEPILPPPPVPYAKTMVKAPINPVPPNPGEPPPIRVNVLRDHGPAY